VIQFSSVSMSMIKDSFQREEYKKVCKDVLLSGERIQDNYALDAKGKSECYAFACRDLCERKVLAFHDRLLALGYADPSSILSSLPKEIIFKIMAIRLPFELFANKFTFKYCASKHLMQSHMLNSKVDNVALARMCAQKSCDRKLTSLSIISTIWNVHHDTTESAVYIPKGFEISRQ
jgi:hypothetical protein